MGTGSGNKGGDATTSQVKQGSDSMRGNVTTSQDVERQWHNKD